MLGVLLCGVFDQEIVNDKGEYCCARFVSPEALSLLHGVIAELSVCRSGLQVPIAYSLLGGGVPNPRAADIMNSRLCPLIDL